MEMTTAELDNLKRCFIVIGKSLTGKLDHNQMEAVLYMAGFKLADDEKEVLLRQVAPQGNQIGWTEVVDSAKELKRIRKAARDKKRTEAIEACRKCDKTGSGSLSHINLILALSLTPLQLYQEQRRAAKQEELASEDMLIKYEEFIEKYLLE